ncbi:unnamed protein product [Amoebophrya sp. A120]|nr:unnamed protein product [Amoebophrya sp. A120]|eukprot:GSA120T00020516001.1
MWALLAHTFWLHFFVGLFCVDFFVAAPAPFPKEKLEKLRFPLEEVNPATGKMEPRRMPCWTCTQEELEVLREKFYPDLAERVDRLTKIVCSNPGLQTEVPMQQNHLQICKVDTAAKKKDAATALTNTSSATWAGFVDRSQALVDLKQVLEKSSAYARQRGSTSILGRLLPFLSDQPLPEKRIDTAATSPPLRPEQEL